MSTSCPRVQKKKKHGKMCRIHETTKMKITLFPLKHTKVIYKYWYKNHCLPHKSDNCLVETLCFRYNSANFKFRIFQSDDCQCHLCKSVINSFWSSMYFGCSTLVQAYVSLLHVITALAILIVIIWLNTTINTTNGKVNAYRYVRTDVRTRNAMLNLVLCGKHHPFL